MEMFKNLEEAEKAVQEVLGSGLTAIFMRLDIYSNDNIEVICVSPFGEYWIIKFYFDGDVGYSIMSTDLSFIHKDKGN